MSIRSFARAIAGLGLCTAIAASAAPYSGLVVFGDSLSDGGNNALLLSTAFGGALPPVVISSDADYSRIPSAAGTYSNGMVWTQYLAQSMGLMLAPSLAGGTNFAFGGAQTGADGNDIPVLPGFPYSMRTQLNTYLAAASQHADPNALYLVAGGGNNIRVALDAIAAGADPDATAAATVAGYASDMAGLVADLKLAGAQHILVMNTPNFGLTPLANALNVSGLTTALSANMNQQLALALAGTGVQTFDVFSFQTGIVSLGAASGFSNWTNACAAAVNQCDVATSLFWDGFHPTTKAHEQLAAAVLAVAVPEPETVVLLTLGLGVVALSVRHGRAARQQG